MLTKVVCLGSEENIMDCRLEGDTSDCDHTMDIGVICLPKGITYPKLMISKMRVYIINILCWTNAILIELLTS